MTRIIYVAPTHFFIYRFLSSGLSFVAEGSPFFAVAVKVLYLSVVCTVDPRRVFGMSSTCSALFSAVTPRRDITTPGMFYTGSDTPWAVCPANFRLIFGCPWGLDRFLGILGDFEDHMLRFCIVGQLCCCVVRSLGFSMVWAIGCFISFS